MIPISSTTPKPITLPAARFIWIAFLCAACGIIFISHVLKPQPQRTPDVLIGRVFSIVAVAEILIFAFIRSRILAQSQQKAQRGEAAMAQASWGVAQILGFASAMSIVLFGFVLHLLSAPPAWISTALLALGVLNMLAYFPQQSGNR